MQEFIICGFYTKKTPYEEEIKGLVQSCKDFGLKCYTQGYDTRGIWVKNCAIKSEFVFEMLLKFKNSNIVYIDADGKIKQYPELFTHLQADIGVFYLKGKELISNTIFFKNTANVQQLVRYWIDMQQLQPTEWDQRILQKCITQYAKPLGLDVYNLPPTYAQIFDTMKDCGRPIIEHYQASRRFKHKVDQTVVRMMPESIRKLNPRVAGDGTFYLTRCTKDIEKALETGFCKLPNESRWYPRSKSLIPLDNLKGYFNGKYCYIVGKGPSLDRLQAIDFKDQECPVICLNESIHKVESLGIKNKLFVLQQDAWLKATCKPKHDTTIMLLNYTCTHWYPDCGNKFTFHFIELGLSKRNNSVIYAMSFAKLCGTIGFKMFCFDAAMNKDTGYAKIIGYSPQVGGDPARFLKHRQPILNCASPLPLQFIPVTLTQ